MKYALQFALVAAICALAAADLPAASLPDEATARIINGQLAAPNQFPWHVTITGVLQNSVRILCGGALISANHVLTTAACVQNPQFTHFILQFGSTNLTRPLLTLEVNPNVVNNRIIHPQFNPTSNINNVALLRLPIPVPTNTASISSIRLPANSQQNNPFTEQFGQLSGHGRVAVNTIESRSLRFVDLRVIPLQQCAQIFGAVTANANTFCTTGREFDVQGPCDLDFGGALVIQEPSGRTMIGLHSFVSNNGCVFGQPAGFVRLGAFLPWITQNAGIPNRA